MRGTRDTDSSGMGAGNASATQDTEGASPAAVVVAVGLAVAARELTATPRAPAAMAGAAAVASAAVVVAVGFAVALGEEAAASARHLCLVALLLRRLLQLVHPRRSLLHLARLHQAFQHHGQPLLIGHVQLGGVVGFQVLPNLRQAHALALLEVEHGVAQHGRHLRGRSGFHFSSDDSGPSSGRQSVSQTPEFKWPRVDRSQELRHGRGLEL